MKFIQRSQYHLESECRRYTVDKYQTSRGFRYMAWFRPPEMDKNGKRDKPWVGPDDLGSFDSADKAKAMCEHHQRSNQQPPQETAA